MTYRTRYAPRQPSKRKVAADLSFLSLGTDNPEPMPEQRLTSQRKTPRKQAESAVNDVIIKTMRMLFKSVLYRNRRGMVRLPNGGMFPYGLGKNGFPDNCGPTPIVITPEMVGRTVGVFTAIEAKTDKGVVAPHQLECIEELRDLGCIAGVATNSTDCEDIVRRWREGK